MEPTFALFKFWRASLIKSLAWFEALRDKTKFFNLKLFIFFIFLNLTCYYWALVTAYHWKLFGSKAEEYILMGFPVSFLGGAFDSLSLVVTIFIIKKALSAERNISYVLYLSVDLLIAIIATFWVLFVFMISGWVVSFILDNPESIGSRMWLYEDRVESAVSDPSNPNNLRNIYFGMIMGASALLPTLLHISLAGLSFLKLGRGKLGLMRGDS